MEDMSTAIHEAGHAVAHSFMGRPFSVVSVVPNDITAGRVECELYEGNTKSVIRKELIIYFAGDLAERFADDEWGNIYNPGMDYDLMAIEDLAWRAYKTTERRRDFLDEVYEEARQLVMSSEWQAAILSVAQALQEQGELDQSGVEKIINVNRRNRNV